MKKLYEQAAENLRDYPEYAKRMSIIERARLGKVYGVNFSKWKDRANCCGTLAYMLGKVPEFLKLLPGRYPAEESDLPEPAWLFPGYIPTGAGLRFIRDKNRCREVQPNEAKAGDIVLFMDHFHWGHAGIYVGEIGRKSMMFAKNGEDGDFEFSGIEECFLDPDLSSHGFFRVLG